MNLAPADKFCLVFQELRNGHCAGIADLQELHSDPKALPAVVHAMRHLHANDDLMMFADGPVAALSALYIRDFSKAKNT
jgi:hypothetical protein